MNRGTWNKESKNPEGKEKYKLRLKTLKNSHRISALYCGWVKSLIFNDVYFFLQQDAKRKCSLCYMTDEATKLEEKRPSKKSKISSVHSIPCSLLCDSKGSALILALWAVILLSMLVASLTFNMHLEAKLTTFHRKRFKAHKLARSGVEWAKFVMYKSTSSFSDEDTYGEDFRIQLLNLKKGLALRDLQPMAQLKKFNGTFHVDIVPEQGRRNVNYLEREDWKEILDRGGVPEDDWDTLIDCLEDWKDENDLHRLNGAESDDDFYKKAGYEVKNAKLDTIDELVLIKGFGPSVVFGGPGEDEDDPPKPGIAQWLTTFGNGRLNVNTATRDVLMTLPEVDEFMVDRILEGRLGADGAARTEDDGFASVGQAISYAGLPGGLSSKLTVRDLRYIRVVSIGEVDGVKTGIWSIFQQDGRDLIPVFWREEQMQ